MQPRLKDHLESIIVYLFFLVLLIEWSLSVSPSFSHFTIFPRGPWSIWLVLFITTVLMGMYASPSGEPQPLRPALVVFFSQIISSAIIASVWLGGGQGLVSGDRLFFWFFQDSMIRVVLAAMPFTIGLVLAAMLSDKFAWTKS